MAQERGGRLRDIVCYSLRLAWHRRLHCLPQGAARVILGPCMSPGTDSSPSGQLELDQLVDLSSVVRGRQKKRSQDQAMTVPDDSILGWSPSMTPSLDGVPQYVG